MASKSQKPRHFCHDARLGHRCKVYLFNRAVFQLLPSQLAALDQSTDMQSPKHGEEKRTEHRNCSQYHPNRASGHEELSTNIAQPKQLQDKDGAFPCWKQQVGNDFSICCPCPRVTSTSEALFRQKRQDTAFISFKAVFIHARSRHCARE